MASKTLYSKDLIFIASIVFEIIIPARDNLHSQNALEKTSMSSPPLKSMKGIGAVDRVEQYKHDLQLQIEQNRRRKEEERQRELEIERKEMAK